VRCEERDVRGESVEVRCSVMEIFGFADVGFAIFAFFDKKKR
jgi:hypothetical protein